MTKEQALADLYQIEKDLETAIFPCMSPFNAMICGTEYQREKIIEIFNEVRAYLYPEGIR